MTVWCPEAHNMTTQISHIETKTASSFRHHPSYIFILHFLATPPCQLSLIGISALMASLAKSSASISLDSGSRHFFLPQQMEQPPFEFHKKNWNTSEKKSLSIHVEASWFSWQSNMVQLKNGVPNMVQHGPTWWWHHLGMGHGTLVPLNPKS